MVDKTLKNYYRHPYELLKYIKKTVSKLKNIYFCEQR